MRQARERWINRRRAVEAPGPPERRCGAGPLTMSLGMALIATLAAGCSFDKVYEEALVAGYPQSPSVLGPWTGRWTSERTGHYGQLRIVAKRLQESGQIRTRVEMQRGALVHEFVVWLEVQPTQEALQVEGSARPGIGAGRFDCDGVVTANVWSSSWRIASDSGRFRVERPARPARAAPAQSMPPQAEPEAQPATETPASAEPASGA